MCASVNDYFSLSLQLQESSLRLSQALWTAKSSKGGFSVSFFWPATDSESEAKPRRRTRKRRSKATTKVVLSTCADGGATSNPPKPSTEVPRPGATPTPINANHHPASPPSRQRSHCNKDSDVKSNSDSEEKSVCDNDQENEMTVDNNDKESEKKTDCEDEKGEWTQVTRKKSISAALLEVAFPCTYEG